MKVAEMMALFHQMPASDRLYLLCKMLQGCLTYELNYVSMVLHGYLKERLSGITEIQGDPNTISHYSRFKDTPFVLKEPLEILSACLALIRHDNYQVGDEVYQLLDQRSILTMAEEIEDLTLFENLRLVYVMAVYHPSLSFQKRHHLLTVFLHQLDEIYNSKVAENIAKETEEREMALESSRPSRPSDTAHIVRCELIGFYKRHADRRYPYVIEVEWSDGAKCNVHRTYGDFFGFQNKLLDLFPDESGQKNKKSRVIPFLPGRRLLSGKSNRELAEKRLPDLYNYTRDLFLLPERISSHKHVQDFFRPHLSDLRDISSLNKLTTLTDIKESKSRHPSAPPSVVLASSNSPKSRSGLNILSSFSTTRNAQTLPPEKSPGPKRDLKVAKHATLPSQHQSAFVPVSPNTPSSSTEKLNSASQTSLGSIDRLLITPTTTTCRIVTPPTARANGSPAFSVSRTSQLTSSSWSSMHSSQIDLPNTKTKQNNSSLSAKISKKASLSTTDICLASTTIKKDTDSVPTTVAMPPTTTTAPQPTSTMATVTTTNVPNSSWAECSPPATTDTSFYFSAHNENSSSTTTTNASQVFCPIQSTPTKRSHRIALSPSLSQLQQHHYGGGSQPSYTSYPISYTPTNFDSPSPSQEHMGMGGGRWQSSYGPLCTTPVNQTPPSEADQCRKWLKVHRLHKYENLFQDKSFSEISSLTVDQLKEMGMTLGAAKKLQQKMEELKQSNIQSFREIPHSSLTRKPSTSSLPAALILQDRQGLTPSSSIDQISLLGSTTSLDVLGQTGGTAIRVGNVHLSNNHDGNSSGDQGVISRIDGAIVEAGPVNEGGGGGGGSRQVIKSSNDLGHNKVGEGRSKSRDTVIRSKSSHGNTNNSNSYGNGLHMPSRSMDNTPSHSPLKIQRSLSPHHLSHLRTNSQNHLHTAHQQQHSQSDMGRDNKLDSNRSSLPTPLTTTASQQHFSIPQFHRKDIHSFPSSMGGEGQDSSSIHPSHHPHPKIPPPMLLSSSRPANWSIAPLLHGGPVVVPNSTAPIIRGRIPPPVLPPGYHPQTINGIIQAAAPTGLAPHVGVHRVPSFPPHHPHHSHHPIGSGPPSAATLSCYNCGGVGHHGSACSVGKSDTTSPATDYHFTSTPFNSKTPPTSNLSRLPKEIKYSTQ